MANNIGKGSGRARVVKLKFCEDSQCDFKETHLLIVEDSVDLARGNATAISYTWGAYERQNYPIGHYADYKDSKAKVVMELGEEWRVTISHFLQALVDICKEENSGFIWMDQLCINQNNSSEVRETLAK